MKMRFNHPRPQEFLFFDMRDDDEKFSYIEKRKIPGNEGGNLIKYFQKRRQINLELRVCVAFFSARMIQVLTLM